MSWDRVKAMNALRSGDLLELGMSANQIRQHLHPAGVVTYALGGPAPAQRAVTPAFPVAKDNSISLTSVRDMEHVSVDALKALIVAQRGQLPGVTFQHLPVSSRHRFAQDLVALGRALPALDAAGLGSICIELEATQPSSFSFTDLVALFRAAAECRIFVSASLTIGGTESLEARFEILEILREAQQESNAIRAVLVRVHHADAPNARREEEATAVDYLKTLAVTRLILDNVEHLQTDWSVMGPKVLELALRFGADDAGSVPRYQAGNVGPSHHGGESELRRIIRDAGFRPVERDALFRQSLLH
jgi:cyclic dehypoxanthinyl futalosine synthase